MVATLKNIAVLLMGGALAGGGVSTLIAPSFLEWYNTGADPNAQCICAVVARATSSQLIRAQLIGALAGAVVFAIAGGLIARARSKRAAPAPSTPSTPPASPPAA